MPSRQDTLRRTVAAIDIGSNAVRFAAARATAGGGLRMLEERRRPTRLGANLATTGRLPRTAQRLTLAAVKEFCLDASRLGASVVRLVATAAVRESPDGATFVSRLSRETGFPVSIIDTDEEARLAFRSCAGTYDLSRRHVAIVDIGGGSVQIALARHGLLYDAISLPLGAVRLTAGSDGLESAKSRRHVRQHIRSVLSESLPRPGVDAGPLDAVIGCGGTFATLDALLSAHRSATGSSTPPGLAISGGKPRPLRSRARTRASVIACIDSVLRASASERESLLRACGVPEDRADILPAGLLVAEQVIRSLDPRALVTHVGGVRDGLLRDLAAPVPDPHAIVPAAREALRSFAPDELAHCTHVSHLAVSLLHELADVEPLRGTLRLEHGAAELLEAAALLHDLAVPIDYARHHKLGRRAIELTPLPFSARDRAVVANVVRYHRRALPTLEHAPFRALTPRDRDVVRVLAGILRIADGLDRAHDQGVHGLRTVVQPGRLRIVAEGVGEAGLKGARKKADLLSLALRRVVRIEPG